MIKKVLFFLGLFIFPVMIMSCSQNPDEQVPDWLRDDFKVWNVTQLDVITGATHGEVFVMGQVIAMGEFILEDNNERYFILADGTSTAIVRGPNQNTAIREWMAGNLSVGDILFVHGFPNWSGGGTQGNLAQGTTEITIHPFVGTEDVHGDIGIRRISRNLADSIVEDQDLVSLSYIEEVTQKVNVDLETADLTYFEDNFNCYLGRQFRFEYGRFTTAWTGSRPDGNPVPPHSEFNFRSRGGTTFAVVFPGNVLQTGLYTHFTAFLVGRTANALRFSIIYDVTTEAFPEREETIIPISELNEDFVDNLNQEVIVAGRVVAFHEQMSSETNRPDHNILNNNGRFMVVQDDTGQIIVRPANNQHAITQALYNDFDVGDIVIVTGLAVRATQTGNTTSLLGNADGAGGYVRISSIESIQMFDEDHGLFDIDKLTAIYESVLKTITIDFANDEVLFNGELQNRFATVNDFTAYLFTNRQLFMGAEFNFISANFAAMPIGGTAFGNGLHAFHTHERGNLPNILLGTFNTAASFEGAQVPQTFTGILAGVMGSGTMAANHSLHLRFTNIVVDEEANNQGLAANFRYNFSDVLKLEVEDITDLEHAREIRAALAALDSLSPAVRELLADEYERLNNLLNTIENLEDEASEEESVI